MSLTEAERVALVDGTIELLYVVLSDFGLKKSEPIEVCTLTIRALTICFIVTHLHNKIIVTLMGNCLR